MCLKFCKTMKVKAKDGNTVIIRRPKTSDIRQLKNFINSLIEENTYILMNKRMTLKEEKEWLKEVLKSIRNNGKHMLVAVYKGKIVGNVELKKGKWKRSHVAEFAIGIKKGYRRLGLATLLSKAILEVGKKDKEIKVIYLTVFPPNKPAKSLYKKLGFREIARLRKRIKHKGKYLDEIVMDLKKQNR